jgi:hypothetical protein
MVMRKFELRRWNDTHWIFCLVFLLMGLKTFAQPSSKGKDTATYEVSGAAINTASWETRDLPNIRLRFKLPPGYTQKQWQVVVGSPPAGATFQVGHVNQIDFAVENTEDPSPESAKDIPQKNYIDYKEWSQFIGGREYIVQTFQGGGVIIDEEGKRPPYCVESVAAIDAKHRVRVSATLGNQERQQEVLAMLKTIEFY